MEIYKTRPGWIRKPVQVIIETLPQRLTCHVTLDNSCLVGLLQLFLLIGGMTGQRALESRIFIRSFLPRGQINNPQSVTNWFSYEDSEDSLNGVEYHEEMKRSLSGKRFSC